MPGEEGQDHSFPRRVWLPSMAAARLHKADLLASYPVALSRRPKRGVAKVWTQKEESPTIPLPSPLDTGREAGLGTEWKQGSPQVGAVSNSGFLEEHPSEKGH